MRNFEHLKILALGVNHWNLWRDTNPNIVPHLSLIDFPNSCPNLSGYNLSGANLSLSDLTGVDLSGANLSKASLRGAKLVNANLSEVDAFEADLENAKLTSANLSNVNFHNANLRRADLTKAILTGSDFSSACFRLANLSGADFSNADLSNADLSYSNLVKASFTETDISNADLSYSRIYGISVWGGNNEGTNQNNLIITNSKEPKITVDNLEIAQFIYLLLDNQKFRDVIETITSKAVLILGRFTDERKKVLDAMRDELRNRNFLPILFDFEKPATRDLTETISILAKLSRFVIADLTDAKSIPQELSHIVPNMPSLPVIPLILKGQREYGMFEHWRPYPWVLPVFEYDGETHLIENLSIGVIDPAERKVQEIRNK